MEFAKLNLFKKIQDEMPVGLSSLGLKKKSSRNNGKKNKKKTVYPCFFGFDKINPIGI